MYEQVQEELTRRYRVARMVWREMLGIRDAAATLNMSERDYCDAFVAANFTGLTWTITSIHPEWAPDYDKAFEDAA